MGRVHELRSYQIDPGRFEEFIQLWRKAVVPLRRKAGFEIEGAWVDPGAGRFVWVISHDSVESFEAAAEAYYDMPERQALEPSPRDYLEEVSTVKLQALEA